MLTPGVKAQHKPRGEANPSRQGELVVSKPPVWPLVSKNTISEQSFFVSHFISL